MIFTHFQGVSVTPLGGNECISLYGNSMPQFIALAKQMVSHSNSSPCYTMYGTLACFSSRCFFVAASVLSRASIIPLHSIDSNTIIPTKGCDTNTLKTREYHLHLIKIPSHFCAKTSYGLLLASCPGSRGGGKRAWYTPFAHALNYFKFLSLFASSTIAHSYVT